MPLPPSGMSLRVHLPARPAAASRPRRRARPRRVARGGRDRPDNAFHSEPRSKALMLAADRGGSTIRRCGDRSIATSDSLEKLVSTASSSRSTAAAVGSAASGGRPPCRIRSRQRRASPARDTGKEADVCRRPPSWRSLERQKDLPGCSIVREPSGRVPAGNPDQFLFAIAPSEPELFGRGAGRHGERTGRPNGRRRCRRRSIRPARQPLMQPLVES